MLLTPISTYANWFNSKKSADRRQRALLIEESRLHLGKPYRWDQSGPDAFDCSGFVYYVLKKSLGADRFPLSYALGTMKGYRSQSVFYRDQLRKSGAAIDCRQAKPGDIVFFSPLQKGENNHIGIVTDPTNQVFITAQGRRAGVAEHSYSEGSYWGLRNPECYNNVWLSLR
jgi:cell wall-associated NlpC family hydrolase